MHERSYYVLLNPRSGTASALGLTGEVLQARLSEKGYRAIVDADDEAPFEERIARARASDCEVVVAAGGDGTASGLASALLNHDKTFAVLPLGTVNSLAKDLGVPLDVDGWIAALGDMETRQVDVGEVNGRIFLHMVVIGLIPGMAAAREHLRDRSELGAKIGLVRYFLRRLSRTRRLALLIDPADDNARVQRVQALAVACNGYDEGLGRVLTRTTLDSGMLTLYVLKRLGLSDIVRLGVGMLIGRWQHDRALDIASVPAVTIRSHKPKLQVMLDGEIESLAVPLRFGIRARALRVLAAPAPKEQVDPLAQPAGAA